METNTEQTLSSLHDSKPLLADAFSIGNKLIAEFMGYYEDGIYWTNGSHKLGEGGFLYNSSWDWLMPVVEKIESLNKYYVCFDNYRNRTSIRISDKRGNEINDSIYVNGENKIESFYNATIEFITWYKMDNA